MDSSYFFIKVYANQRSKLPYKLKLSIFEKYIKFDFTKSYVFAFFRTVASAVIVIQHHKLIQTVSDRLIKASCYLDNNVAPPIPQYNNLSLNASFYVKDPT